MTDEQTDLDADQRATIEGKVDKQRVPATFEATEFTPGRFMVAPRTFEEVWRIATLFSRAGGMVPEIYRGNPEATAMAIMWGMELGISAIAAIQGINVIGGRASVWGDLQHALVLTHQDYEAIEETVELHQEGTTGEPIPVSASCTIYRKGRDPITRTFSMLDAIRASLATKDTWKKYPQRMLAMRARSWAERDQFPDALRGLASADEMIDVTPVAIGAPKIATPRAVPIEHQAPDPLLQTIVPTVVPSAAGETVRERVREATPDLATMAGTQGQVDFADMDDLGPAPASAVEAARGDEGLVGPAAKRTPLTKGQRNMFDAFLNATKGAVTEQMVVDELGDDVHQGNFDRATKYIVAIAPERKPGA